MKSFCQNFTPYLLLLVLDLVFVGAAQQWYIARNEAKFLIEMESKYNYLQAVDECARRDLQLVVLDNAEKNIALVEVIQSFSEKPIALWIDLQDEFNTEINLNRSFYSVSTGHQNLFSSWRKNEPNNGDNNEHCVEMVGNSDYLWNDINCENKMHGYVCEEHHLTTLHKKNLDLRRDLINFTLTDTISDFEEQIKEINEINANTRKIINNIMTMRKNFLEVLDNDTPNEDFEKVTTETVQAIEGAQLNAADAIERLTTLHSSRLESDTTFIDGVLSHN